MTEPIIPDDLKLPEEQDQPGQPKETQAPSDHAQPQTQPQSSAENPPAVPAQPMGETAPTGVAVASPPAPAQVPPATSSTATSPTATTPTATTPTATTPTTTSDEETPFPGFVPTGGNTKRWLLVMAGAALLGGLFSAVSTADFIQHLDRQVHSIHCSFIPGAGQGHGESGCRAALMSTYSSVFRSSMWGGLPIALWSLAVFAYLFFRSLEFALRPQINKRETLFLLAAWGLPVVMSIGYGLVAVSQLGSVCKLCVGIYFSSALGFGLSVWLHRQAKPQPRHTTARIFYWRWFGEGVGFVAVLTIVYLVLAPTNPKSLSGCGTLAKKQDPAKILLPTSSSTKGPSAARGVFGVAVMDPLCGACRGFHNRLTGSGLLEQVDLHTMLMPLDSACNWMVKDSLHPGACQVSEAILCDPKNAQAIMDYAFLHQDALLELGKTDRKQLAKRLATAFPQVRSCLGTPHIRNKLNKSLRWAVANALPVLTPQLFIGERRVCDEDTDLGLEYTVAQMLQRATTKGRR